MEERVSRDISPNDEMYLFARTQIPTDEMTRWYYFQTGKEVALGVIRHLLAAEELDLRTLDLLDYAAGYGRVTRWLAPVFRSVTVADLEPAMIDFHKRTFGIDGFVASADPKHMTTGERNFDVVLVFSLFTHLPRSSWPKWLRAIADTIKPGGAFIFSVHSYELFAELNPARFGDPKTWTEDFLFWEDNETNGRLKTAAYGCTIVKESYVRAAVANLPGFEVAHHYKKGEFDRYHDIYAIRRR